MANYMVEAPHTDAQCLAAMDEIVAEQPQLLAELSWGCMSGVHTGWANVEAESESAARLPARQLGYHQGGAFHRGADQGRARSLAGIERGREAIWLIPESDLAGFERPRKADHESPDPNPKTD